MNNPLTNEQIDKLNELAKLPVEEQKIQLSAFLKTLNSEQIEFLKSQQQGSGKCLFCSIAEGSSESLKIYEDDNVIAVLDINPASKGHTLIIPKKHYRFFTEIEDTRPLFEVVKIIVDKLHKTYNADASIVISNGFRAGQKLDHVSIHVIPRYENDNINLTWQPNKFNKEELAKVFSELKTEKKIEAINAEPEEEPFEEIDFQEDRRIP